MRMSGRLFTLCLAAAIPLSALAGGSDSGDLKAARKVHKKQCQKCHGKSGEGDGPSSRMLKVKPAEWTDAKRMAVLSDEDLFKVIQSGGESVGLSKLMPAFHSKLSDEETAQLVTFIKSLLREAKT